VNGFVCVRRYACLEEARVACAFLRSGDVDAELDHEYLCSMQWYIMFATQVGLRVPSHQAEDALEAMALVDAGAFAIPDIAPLPRSLADRLKAAFMLFFV